MNRQQALDILRSHRAELKEFAVKSLSLFGSVARDEGTAVSDVDLLVEFDRPVGLFAFIRLQQFLTQLLGCRVDLATPDALKPALRESILKEAIRAA